MSIKTEKKKTADIIPLGSNKIPIMDKFQDNQLGKQQQSRSKKSKAFTFVQRKNSIFSRKKKQFNNSIDNVYQTFITPKVLTHSTRNAT